MRKRRFCYLLTLTVLHIPDNGCNKLLEVGHHAVGGLLYLLVIQLGVRHTGAHIGNAGYAADLQSHVPGSHGLAGRPSVFHTSYDSSFLRRHLR